MRPSKWTPKLERFLSKNWLGMTNRELALSVGLSETATREKLYELGYKKCMVEFWQPEEVEFLERNYQTKGDTEIARLLTENFREGKKIWKAPSVKKKRNSKSWHRNPDQVAAIRERNVSLILDNENYKNARRSTKVSILTRKSREESVLKQITQSIRETKEELNLIASELFEYHRFDFAGKVKLPSIARKEERRASLELKLKDLKNEYFRLPKRLIKHVDNDDLFEIRISA